MGEMSIGIILPKRQWNRLALEELNDDDSFVFHYAKTGEELNLEVLFINIDELLVNEGKGKAFIIKEQEIVLLGFVKIPSIIYNSTIYHQKKHKRKIFELAKQTGVTVINEQNHIKKKTFLDLVESHPALKDVIMIADNQPQPSFNFYVLGQKDFHHQWTTPIVYAKNNDEIYTFAKAYPLLTENQLMEETKDYLYEVSHRILEILHYYYPAIYEIGLQFVMMENGEMQIQSTCPISNIVKDIWYCNEKLAVTILQWPIELAKSISEMENSIKSESNLLLDSEDFQDDKITPFVGKASQQDENVWVKFKVFQENEMTMKLPDRIAERWREQPEVVKFGINEQPCNFVIYEDAIPLRHNSYQNPADLFVSHTLVGHMHLPLDLVYQIQFSEGKAIIGPTIGLLLGEKNKVYNLQYMEKFNDRFGEYHRYGGVTIAFSARSVDWEKKIAYGMVFDPVKKNWRYYSTPIPSTIYRRNFHQKKENIKQLKKLTDNNLFNSYHFKKSDLYLLKNNPEIKQHLPATFLLNNMDDLIDFLIENKKIILKPVSLSRGRGIFILELNNESEGFSLYDYRNMTKVQHILEDKKGLQALLKEFGIFHQEYLFQTYIPLLKVNNRSLDVRVVMQKYNKRKWQCTGIECRVAREHEDLTNIARGGEAMTLEAVIKNSTQGLTYSQVYRNILNLCQRFCRLMDQKNEHFAEFGIDIALDDEGFPWILEANIYPSFKGFKTLDYDTYLRIRNQPMFYAVQIQGFQILEEDAFGNTLHYRERAYL
ncbi:YheC/YheD family protein [Neobacillus drentensis]|uniref:YheC/YheD family endospore coat-associated protein n=1 Tax=Neobacillus drentensis TaxID=220684 RepID=UPI002FFF7078